MRAERICGYMLEVVDRCVLIYGLYMVYVRLPWYWYYVLLTLTIGHRVQTPPFTTDSQAHHSVINLSSTD